MTNQQFECGLPTQSRFELYEANGLEFLTGLHYEIETKVKEFDLDESNLLAQKQALREEKQQLLEQLKGLNFQLKSIDEELKKIEDFKVWDFLKSKGATVCPTRGKLFTIDRKRAKALRSSSQVSSSKKTGLTERQMTEILDCLEEFLGND